MRAKEAEKKRTTRMERTKVPTPLEEEVKYVETVCGTNTQREGRRRDVVGLFLPSEWHTTLTGVRNTEPGGGTQLPRAHALQWVLSEAKWNERNRHARRFHLVREDQPTASASTGVLVIEETGDRAEGHRTAPIGRHGWVRSGLCDQLVGGRRGLFPG
jgi:hypothetical protein